MEKKGWLQDLYAEIRREDISYAKGKKNMDYLKKKREMMELMSSKRWAIVLHMNNFCGWVVAKLILHFYMKTSQYRVSPVSVVLNFHSKICVRLDRYLYFLFKEHFHWTKLHTGAKYTHFPYTYFVGDIIIILSFLFDFESVELLVAVDLNLTNFNGSFYKKKFGVRVHILITNDNE